MAAWFAAGVPKSGTLHKSLVQTSNSALRQTPALQTRRYPQQGAEASPKPASMPVLGTGAASRQRHSKASVALEQTMYSRMSHAAASRHVLSEEATQSQAPNQCMVGKEARPRDKRRPQTLEGRRMRVQASRTTGQCGRRRRAPWDDEEGERDEKEEEEEDEEEEEEDEDKEEEPSTLPAVPVRAPTRDVCARQAGPAKQAKNDQQPYAVRSAVLVSWRARRVSLGARRLSGVRRCGGLRGDKAG
ncbi:unnamed protein product [Prorocentrum cordatum]|uniref:Uncharacterized protein n=1 Tax=Prorocentrum cordatum TaxID=2364126 RepID=A0ABN9PBV8_9DINO|nr:unnamed protein product [Polarella glacialis]